MQQIRRHPLQPLSFGGNSSSRNGDGGHGGFLCTSGGGISHSVSDNTLVSSSVASSSSSSFAASSFSTFSSIASARSLAQFEPMAKGQQQQIQQRRLNRFQLSRKPVPELRQLAAVMAQRVSEANAKLVALLEHRDALSMQRDALMVEVQDLREFAAQTRRKRMQQEAEAEPEVGGVRGRGTSGTDNGTWKCNKIW